jgi:MlaC protein
MVAYRNCCASYGTDKTTPYYDEDQVHRFHPRVVSCDGLPSFPGWPPRRGSHGSGALDSRSGFGDFKQSKTRISGCKARTAQSLASVIYPRFDFAEMSRRSLGPSWRQITPSEQQEFVQLFTQLLEESYINNIEAYNGEKILYSGAIGDALPARRFGPL